MPIGNTHKEEVTPHSKQKQHQNLESHFFFNSRFSKNKEYIPHIHQRQKEPTFFFLSQTKKANLLKSHASSIGFPPKMVQRKVPNKLRIQVDHLKTSKPSCLQHQDCKNGGGMAGLKKKMKKTGSSKGPELESQGLRRQVKQPVKPSLCHRLDPKLTVQQLAPLASSQKQSLTVMPNYMRSTTSSDARKEQSRVSSTKNPQTSRVNSSLAGKGSNSSGNKATKTLDRATSLEKMRTLTKTPSFKPSRVKKCSRAVLCEDLDVKRATCSSTLKDYKFPAHLKLSPGGTESEGTSAMKACLYNYCSLNGHRPVPLPTLKSFLSAMRRALKTQRSIKLDCPSPRQPRPIGDGKNFDEVMTGTKVDSLTQEEHDDFFIEIYNQEKGNTAKNHEEKVAEMLLDGPISYDTDPNENLEENQEAEAAEEVSPPSLADGAKPESLSETAVQSMPSVEFHEVDSEYHDMDWKTCQQSPLYLNDDHKYSPKMEKESDQEEGKVNNHAEFMVELQNRLSCFFDEVPVHELLQESFDEKSWSSDEFSISDDGESISSYDYRENSSDAKTSTPAVVPVEEPEAAREVKNDFMFDSNQTANNIENHDNVEQECNQAENSETAGTTDPENEPRLSEFSGRNSTETEYDIVHENLEIPENIDSSPTQAIVRCKKPMKESDEMGPFNPRAPNFLPLEPDPEAEKVDLRHQELDERKNAEEWMVDYALRQAVTKLAPARKRKVALLVEAFENVMPTKA